MSVTVWVSVVLLIFANALYVSAEFGAVGARRSRIRRLADDGNPWAKRLVPFIESPAALDRYVSASQIGITLSSLGLGAYGQVVFGAPLSEALLRWFPLDTAAAESWAAAIILFGLTAAQIVLGELVPKSLALQHPTEVALATVLPMRWSLTLFRPWIAMLNGTATLLLRAVGVKAGAHRHIHSPDEIDLLIAESRDGGLLEPEEQQRLHRALRLGLRSARDLMVPLDRLTMLKLDTSWDDVVKTVAGSPFSRLPVYSDSPTRIVGMLRVVDLVERYVSEGAMPLDRLIRPALFLSDSLPADRVIGMLRERRIHQAVVTDASGSAVGLITIQDVLQELLGSREGRR